MVSPDTVAASVQNNNQEVMELRELVKQEEERLEEQATYLVDEKLTSGEGQQRKVKNRLFGAVMEGAKNIPGGGVPRFLVGTVHVDQNWGGWR